jgi:hypothetical protein
MTAGKNQIAKWWRFYQNPDDYIGGSVPTGTILNDSVMVRIEPKPPTMALLEQGVETIKLFQTAVSYVARDIKENDMLEVYEPSESWYAGQMFRVVNVQHPSLRPNDPRSEVQVLLRRWDEAHGRQP